MLPSVGSLSADLLTLPEELNSAAAATNFINKIAAFMDQVQAGPTGSPGIFTYNKPPAIAGIQALTPVIDNSWITNFANAIHSGSTSATLTPGTVTSPVWTASLVDTFPPTITTLSAALSTLISDLASVTSGNNPPMPLAQAISNYTLAFTFECTGLATSVPSPIPVPLPFSAE
jgi:hypothetical protein